MSVVPTSLTSFTVVSLLLKQGADLHWITFPETIYYTLLLEDQAPIWLKNCSTAVWTSSPRAAMVEAHYIAPQSMVEFAPADFS